MPAWAVTVLSVAAVVVAAGVLWQKLIYPLARVIHEGQEVVEHMIPVLRDVTRELADTPDAFAVLQQIIAQFRTDSGSSLRDVVDALTLAADAHQGSIAQLIAEASAFRLLAEGDRVQIARLIAALDRVDVKVDSAAVEAAGVAAHLAASLERADAIPPGEAAAGEAADAAARSGE